MTTATASPANPSHLVILGHPSSESFNSAIAARYVLTVLEEGHETFLRDLYREKFSPLLSEAERTAPMGWAFPADVLQHIDLVRRCTVVTFVFPLWFGMPPAMIKGYVDRVFGAILRQSEEDRSVSPLRSKKHLAVITTSAATLPWLEERRMWTALRQSFDNYLSTILGFESARHHHIEGVVDNLPSTRATEMLNGVEQFAQDLCATFVPTPVA